jgi:hypothetical protein
MTFENLRAFFLINLLAQVNSKNDDQTAFRAALEHLGYEPKMLVPTRARRYNISFHSRAIEGGEADPL